MKLLRSSNLIKRIWIKSSILKFMISVCVLIETLWVVMACVAVGQLD